MKKILIMKKSQLIASAVICLFAVSFIVLNFVIPSIPVIMMQQKPIHELPMIVLDPGHGGSDGGAVSKSGIPEKNINLSIVRQLKQYLLLSGFNVVMTREGDASLHTNEKTLKAQKTADLNARLKIMNESLNATVVSIHLNSFPQQASSNGAQVFYSTNGDQSKILGEITQATLVEVLDKQNHRLAKESYNTIYIMKKALNTAILVECGFLSNEHEAALLSDEHYQNKIAFAIYLSLLRYIGGDTVQIA